MYIIAEMACSHEGDPALAQAIIDGAGKVGANAIQFQIWRLELASAPSLPNYAVLQNLEMSFDVWRDLHTYSKKHYPEMEIIACVSERESLAFAETLGVDAYKIHASDLENPVFISAVAKTGKRIDLAVGATTKEEITRAIGWIRETSSSPVWLMYGVQNFPTRSADAHLLHMLQLREDFALPVGYQDHSDAETHAAFWIPAASVGMGIDIQEKHITHDRSKKGIDHEAALNPDEFTEFVRMCNEVQAARGKKEWRPFSPNEEKYRAYARKSIVAARDLAKGTVLMEDDLLALRASPPGLPPVDLPRFLGKTLECAKSRYEHLISDDVRGD
ncbi:hypothetical protein A3C37_04615 [Candidatus Peribacteria bacterium RIFCSPHIGHO2_02_FULL_53_20]|nr:MAG: hypothetical protein A2881_01610 [Candidatus Peribacteria bacterium RIFCSPHIGHO2_01_FULL_55_13]OGJ62773.1 MAG: hypothetical protein A3C37_04615 [Candidatus Peribacteria bacterium RIFCSPHIGHO2_02_FULL_53_20]OGJ66198.1 MAG: hypothetical protein A3B61_02690 [Candidatus Peribacteria bacterium RIFCSPLOWO2_01_FULL_53_10]OGJ69911.1 MAG: hypothetical protein A3G69_02475 [Candidatus Peribacteria bacterium RIFCSPLOWO2_12_FULL_53_10]